MRETFYISLDENKRVEAELTEDGLELLGEEEWVADGEEFTYGDQTWTDGHWSRKDEQS